MNLLNLNVNLNAKENGRDRGLTIALVCGVRGRLRVVPVEMIDT